MMVFEPNYKIYKTKEPQKIRSTIITFLREKVNKVLEK